MPSHFELLNAMKFDRIAGIVTHGHFDHDAACITGPTFEDDEFQPISLSKAITLNTGDDLSPIVEESFTIPRTGEVLYRLFHKK
jgi:hypothetical protein